MEETEKMTALKKAYAEIILNTAKEAAARIIVSERRAQLFQRDLSATKEEALRIMLRIKQMIDLKMNEDETKSLIQRKRIDELEAQLHEAEDIVSNLRADLYETQAELEKLSRNQQRPLDSQSHHPEETALADVTNGQQNNLANHRTSENRNASSCHCEDADKTDVTSTIIKSTKPGLYRHGYTQRIRACDNTILNGHLSLSEEPDDDCKSGKLYKADKGGYRIDTVVPASGEETAQNEEKCPVYCNETTKDSIGHLRLKRKRATRQKRNRYKQEVVTDKDLEIADALILFTQESVSKTEKGVTGSEEEQENPTSAPEKSNPQVSDLSDVISIQSPKSRIFKYTFQRKRRRESNQSISIDDNNIPQMDISKQTTGKEKDDNLNTVKSESSHDSWQMAHVARQRRS